MVDTTPKTTRGVRPPAPDAFVARATRRGWPVLAWFAVAVALMAALMVGGVLMAAQILRYRADAVGILAAIVTLAFLVGLPATAFWFLWWQDRGNEPAEEFGRARPGGAVMAIDADGIYFGGLTARRCRRVPWAQVAEIVVTDGDIGGDDSGFPVYVPYLVVREWPVDGAPPRARRGDPLGWGKSCSLADVPGDEFAAVREAVRRHAPSPVQVTDLREHTAPHP